MDTPIPAFFTAIALTVSCHAQQLLHDDFSGPSIDPARWRTVTTGVALGPTAVFVANGECVLQNRGRLVTTQQFDPIALGGIRVTGSFRFADTHDYITVMTRSDAVPVPPYASTRNGIAVDISWETAPHLFISVRGNQLQLTPTQVIAGSHFQPQRGITYTFEVVDDGANVMASVRGPSQFVQLRATVLGDTTTVKLIEFHNREAVRFDHFCPLDDVSVDGGIAPRFIVFGSGCTGAGGTPTLAAAPSSLPRLGTMFGMQIGSLPAVATVVMPFLGFSDTSTNGVPLPRGLAHLGMPGCQQLADVAHTWFLLALAPTMQWTLAMPDDPSLVGSRAYVQAAVGDPTANAMGLSLSNAGALALGY